MRPLRDRRLCFRACVALILLLTLAAACGGDEAATETPPAAEPAPVTEQAPAEPAAPAEPPNVAEARQLAEAAMDDPEFTPGLEPFDMSVNKGKTIWFNSVLLFPIAQANIDGFREAAKAAGLSVKVWDGKGRPPVWNQGILQAINQKVDGIFLQANTTELTEDSVKKAQDAGIPVVDWANWDSSASVPDLMYGMLAFSFIGAAKTMVDYVIWQSNGEGNVLYLNDPAALGALQQAKDATQDEFERLCPNCEVKYVDIVYGDIPTEVPQIVANALRENPDIDWIIPAFDAAVTYVEQGVRAVGAEDRIRLVSADGVPENVDAMRKGGLQEADVALPNEWVGWAAADVLGRAMAGVPRGPISVEIPTRLITRDENLPPEGEPLIGTDFRNAYLELWGLR